MNTRIKLLAAASIIASFALSTSFADTNASKLYVENKTGDKLTVIIEPGLGGISEHKGAIKEDIANGQNKNIEITKNADFIDSFSITGRREEDSVKSHIKDAGSVFKHTCHHLKLGETYNVHFTKNSLGQIECKHMVAK